jgi:peptidoglycan-associated lipoprotein
MKSIGAVLSITMLCAACSSVSPVFSGSDRDQINPSGIQREPARAIPRPATTEAALSNGISSDSSVRPLTGDELGGKQLDDIVAQLRNPNNLLSKRSIYFDLDAYVIRDEFHPMIQAHAALLREHSKLHVRVEGNCDERGSREYNLALGQRRAEAVKRTLVLLGVPSEQMEAISLGSEKPKVQSSDEAAWAENRRSDMIYTFIENTKTY